MKNSAPTVVDAPDVQEIARQAQVELAILLVIEQSLRMALQWMTRDRGNSHKLSTLRFHTSSFERHVARVKIIADYGGYMHAITDANPHLASSVGSLQSQRAHLHANLTRIIVRLDHVSPDDADGFEQISADLARILDEFRTHGRQESELLQHSFAQEEGGSG